MRVTRNYMAEIRRRAQREARREAIRAGRQAAGEHSPAVPSGRDMLTELEEATVTGLTVGYHKVEDLTHTVLGSGTSSINAYPVAYSDDGYEVFQLPPGAIVGWNDATALNFIRSGSSCSWGFIRFPDCPIYQGSTIVSAEVQGYVESATYDDPNFTIFGELTANSATLSGTSFEISTKTRTTASASWVATGIGTGYQSSPDLTAVVQEIVNQAGYAQGNAVGIIFQVNTGAAVQFRPIGHATPNPFKLVVTYSY